MEYEIDDESRLFDDSTNPSLEHTLSAAQRKPHDVRRPRHEPEEAVMFPEEEHQLA